MFIAKFNQVNGSSTKIKSNKHGQMPYIGTLVAGKSTGTIVDAAIFENGLNAANQLYLCENTYEVFEGKKQSRVVIIAPVTPLEFFQMAKDLGSPVLSTLKNEVTEEREPATADAGTDDFKA